MKVTKLTPPEGNNEHETFATVYKPVRGWTAIIYAYNTTEDWLEDGQGFWEPWQTGICSFKTRKEAIKDAKAWAEAEEIPYKEGT